MNEKLKYEIERLFKAKDEDLELFKQQTLAYRRNNNFLSGQMLKVGELPFLYTLFGFQKNFVWLPQRNIDKVIQKHDNSYDKLDNIMKEIADPIMIFRSKKKRKERSLIVLTSYIDNNQKQEVVILNPINNRTIIDSIYGYSEYEIVKSFDRLVYVDKNKTLSIAGHPDICNAKRSNTESDAIILEKWFIVNRYCRDARLKQPQC
ncbi:MAG: hypothetical protein LBV16_05500 [Elusimicrobiota bacterium]|jgi:hypothetical protein|nr:hypothetical protein [Elusimicrobiota bacterium]